jgi:HK97 family phage prohead protease
MSTVELLLDEQTELKFDMEIQGADARKALPRFVIETDKMDLSFSGKMDGDTVVFDIPILANTLETNQYKCRLELVVEGDRFFTPMEATLDALLPVKVRAGLKGNKKVVEKKKNILVTGVKVKEEVEDIKVSVADELKRDVNADVETKMLNLEFKFDGETGQFKGYGANFGNMDGGRDIISKGAFTKTLQERTVKMLWQHDQKQPIGVFETVYEDEKGLVVEGQLTLGVQQADEAYLLMKSGAIGGLSIGYKAIKGKYDRKNDIRHLDEVKLMEVSVVTFPMNDDSGITDVKNESSDSDSAIKKLIASLEFKDEPNNEHSDKPGIAHSDEPDKDHSPEIKTINNLINTLKGNNNE